MKYSSIFMLSLSLISSVVSMENTDKSEPISELSKRLGILSLKVKEELHRSMVYSQKRFQKNFKNSELNYFINLDNEICHLRKKFPKNSKHYLGPNEDEQTIIQELRKEYYYMPNRLDLHVTTDSTLPKEYFPIEIIFISDQEASRAILIDLNAALLPRGIRQPGTNSLRLPCHWSIPENTHTKWTSHGLQELEWDNLLQKNKSFFQLDEFYTEENYIEEDWNNLFQAGSKFHSLEKLNYGEDSCISKFPLVIYHGTDEPLLFSYSIMFKTQNGLVYQDRFLNTLSYTLKEDKFQHPIDYFSGH